MDACRAGNPRHLRPSRRGRNDQAVERITAAAGALPDDPEIVLLKAHALAVAGRRDEAARLLQEWPGDGEHHLLSLALLSEVLMDLDQPDAAIEALKRGLRRRKDREALKLVRYNLARILERQGRAREAAGERHSWAARAGFRRCPTRLWRSGRNTIRRWSSSPRLVRG